MASDKPGFFAELRRRNVLRASALYIAAVWAISQGISQLSGPFGLPNGVTVWFVVACAIGFPFWVAFAWFYEFTPQGIKRESEVERGASITHRTGRKLNYWITGVLALAVVLLLTNQLILHRHATLHEFAGAAAAPAAKPAPAAFNPPADTLVVLPFENLSNDANQQYFSDGITEELTNALGQNTGLRVIAWDTASHYRDSRQSATDVGKALDVANVLTGKILREGNEIRVIVELVNARTGYQVWASHYDDSLANVFQVQDKISASIAAALQVKFAAARSVATVNPQAHDLVLRANALVDKASTAAPYEQARKLYEQAIALAPAYADAHAGLAHAWFELTQFSTLPIEDALPKVRKEVHQALALDPRNVEALLVLGNADQAEGKLAAAKAGFERALAIDPSNAMAHMDYGNQLALKPGLAQFLEAVQLDPDNATAQNDLAEQDLDLGEYAQAQALAPWQAVSRLDPTSANSPMELALAYSLLHRDADAVKVFDLAQPNTALAKALVAAGRLTYQSLLDSKLHAQALTAVDALLRRADLDPFSMGDVIQLELALGQNAATLAQLPKFCASFAVACSDLSVNPLYLSLHGGPRFEALVNQYDTVSKSPVAASAASSP